MGRNGSNSYTEYQILNYEKDVKFNIKRNMYIARKLSGLKIKDAGPQLGIEPESLKRIEAMSSSTGPSLEVLACAINLYNVDANFYFEDSNKHEYLLKDLKEQKED